MSWLFASGGQSIWSFNFSISPSNEHPGLISFRMDWLDLLEVQGTLKSLLQHHSSKASVLWLSTFYMVQLSHPYMTTGKTIALTRWTFVGKVMSLLFNMLSRLVIAFLPRSKCLSISWPQSPSAVILEPKTSDPSPNIYPSTSNQITYKQQKNNKASHTRWIMHQTNIEWSQHQTKNLSICHYLTLQEFILFYFILFLNSEIVSRVAVSFCVPTSNELEFPLWSPVPVRCMSQGAQGWCTGTTQRDGMVREVGGGSGWGTHVNPWLIHVNVCQNPLQYCKVISLQLKQIN